MNKFLNFAIKEETGRTFELPLDEAIEILKTSGYYESDMSEEDMAYFLFKYSHDEIEVHEKDNSNYDWEVDEYKIF